MKDLQLSWLQKLLLKWSLGEIHNLQMWTGGKGQKKTNKKKNPEKNKSKFKGHAPLFQTVLHCTQAENVAADGSGVTNALIVHYIWRIQPFETQKGWGVGIQSIR